MVESRGNVHISLVTSKTKVAPIKRLTIPRLELYGALLLARILRHAKELLHISTNAWTDSTIVLSWLVGSSRRFKIFVGNRVASTVDLIPPERWRHVINPADCALRGLFPSKLREHELWWNGPAWLKSSPEEWPKGPTAPMERVPDEEIKVCLTTTAQVTQPIIPLDRYSTFTRLKYVAAWILRYKNKCRARALKKFWTRII